MDGLKQRINELRVYTAEEEWFEFKDSWYDEVGIAEYISSMSNAAAMHGEENAYLVWGGIMIRMNLLTHHFLIIEM